MQKRVTLFIFAVGIAFAPSAGSSQVRALQVVSCPKCYTSEVVAAAASPSNPYVGSQVGYDFGAGGDFGDNLLVSGQVVLDGIITTNSRLHLPIMGNLSDLRTTGTDDTAEKLKDLATSSRGISLAFAPYYTLGNRNLSLTGYASFGGKLNAARNAEEETKYVPQGRVSGGVEVGVLNTISKNPIIFTIGPAFSFVSRKDSEQLLGGRGATVRALESSLIVPLGSGLAMMLNHTAVRHADPQLRFGILLVNRLRAE